MKIRMMLFFVVFWAGCASVPTLNNSDLGTTTLNDFDAKAAAKGYGRWKSWDYYDHQIVGWNKVMVFPYYAIFDQNEILVEYIGTMATKDPDPNDYEVLRNARQRAIQTMRAELSRLEKVLQVVSRPLICSGEQICKKAFTLTQIFISENAGMKIQLATDSIIETYGSKDAIVMKATKIPGAGDTEAIRLQVSCPDQSLLEIDEAARLALMVDCLRSQISQLENFSSFLVERVPQLRVQ